MRQNTYAIRTFLVLVLLCLVGQSAQSREFGGFDDPFPLRPADTSSPRDTLRSFIAASKAILDARRAGDHASAARHGERALMTLDLSELPAHSLQVDVGVKLVLLKEVLDRISLPPYNRIPGRQEVREDKITAWTIPNTGLTIALVEEGPRQGEFLFTKETVAALEQSFELVRNLPYKRGAEVGLYDELLITPGPLVPPEWKDSLPAWSTTVVARQAVWQWIGLAVLVVVAFLTARWLYRRGLAWDEKHVEKSPWLRFGVPLALLGTIAIVLLVRLAVIDVLWLFGTPFLVVSVILLTTVFATAAWFVVVLAGRLGDAFGTHTGKESRYDRALMRIIFRLTGIVLVIYIGVYAADAFGLPIAPLIAGLGVGGLAIALAIRPTLENIIGGLTMFADRPLRVGDFCRYGGEIGKVEAIGLRSTRIRSLDRTIITIPNAEFSQMKLENFEVRDSRLMRTTLQLRYETTPEQMRFVLAKLRELLLGHPKVLPDPARVRFIGYGAYSKDVEIFAYLDCTNTNTFLAIQEDLLLRIEDIVVESGSGFAFPSQTTYFTRDDGFDAERKQDAETLVNSWRQRGKLPFPEFEEEQREQLEDILDYPPKGSPDYHPRVK